ncbi:DUF4147 domain-containing protein [Balneolaceae bacterium YR4-1]|uniref:DUF4147 domain-containing protein n=1 Tax=Halalkalibaculum roseum TaxID=2709311 RepID=A0A6M1T6R6_9BACT|nr:DUF4147 domain-containing protein [Halalkalibaculum roseum]NGP75953.1 DUF4147 domain-containing protein [Halalkalibaculum roseum]
MRDKLLSLFNDALQVLNPYDAVAGAFKNNSIQTGTTTLPLKSFKDVYLLAAGKASIEMARAVMDCGGVNPEHKLVVCPKGSKIPDTLEACTIEAEHPVPGEGSEQAGRAAIQFVKDIPEGALLICCISGGTSSLLVQPAEGISLEELNQTHELLLNSGADIHEMNAVRKHLSQIKGGQLLRHLNKKATLVNLIISDVPGDDPAVIGSGPTVADTSTFLDASKVLSNYTLWEKVPQSVQQHIKRGMSGNDPETIKSVEMKSFIEIVASAKMLANKVLEVAKHSEFGILNSEFPKHKSERDLTVEVADVPFTEDVQKVASEVAGRAKEMVKSVERPCLLVCYGESKVNVTGEGKGGRNQELALRGALKIAGYDHITWLSMGTDGIDGPTDAAGAVVDGKTIGNARLKGLDPEEYLKRNDAYHFHEEMGTLVKTGPTGNNLMDLTMVLVL